MCVRPLALHPTQMRALLRPPRALCAPVHGVGACAPPCRRLEPALFADPCVRVAPRRRLNDLYYPNEQFAHSSRNDGIDEKMEFTLRRFGCDLVHESGILLRLETPAFVLK